MEIFLLLLLKNLKKDSQNSYLFQTLKSLINPTPRPLLIVAVKPELLDRIFYFYNPFEREEVQLLKKKDDPSVNCVYGFI